MAEGTNLQGVGLIPKVPVYGYGDGPGAIGGLPFGSSDPSLNGALPNWSRASNLYICGHSYSALNATPFSDLLPGQLTHPRSQWSQSFAEMLGLSETERYIVAQVPAVAAGSDATTPIGVVPEASTIGNVTYIPNAGVTGAVTNSRTLRLSTNSLLGLQVFVNLPLVTGVNLLSPADVGFLGTSHSYNMIAAFDQVVGGTAAAFRTGAGAYVSLSQSDQIQVSPGVLQAGSVLYWTSLHVGTGIADPGGLVVIRLGGRIRNAAVSGSSSVIAGVYSGGWASAKQLRPLSEFVTGEVNVTALANAGATSISCDPLGLPLSTGMTVRFSNGVQAVLTGSSAINASSIAVAALSGAIPVGEQGGVTPAFEALIPNAIWCILQGINEASLNPLEPSGWREAMRYMIAQGLCSYYANSVRSNHVYVNGTNGAWAALPPASPGNVPQVTANTSGSRTFTASGALGGTLPSVTIKIAPDSMDGDTIDLFFYALVGANHGARANIAVDGVQVTTIDTSSACLLTGSATAGVRTGTATSTNASQTLTATGGFTFQDPLDIGRYVTGPGIAPNTIIQAITSSTVATLSQNAGAAAGAGTFSLIPFIGMVKRLTGIQPGVAHTVTITVTGIDATDGTAALVYAEYGIEGNNPRAPVLVANVPRIMMKTFASDAAVGQLNAELVRVLAGSAPAPGVGTPEPALPSTVALVDLDGLIGGQAPFFTVDGVHPNSRGHAAIAQAFFDTLRSSFSTRQLVAR